MSERKTFINTPEYDAKRVTLFPVSDFISILNKNLKLKQKKFQTNKSPCKDQNENVFKNVYLYNLPRCLITKL